MRALNLITLILVIIGGVNWGLVGLVNLDLVAGVFGTGSTLARTVYIVVGLSALWQLIPFAQALSTDEVSALRRSS